MNNNHVKYYKCPGCGKVWDSYDLYYSEGVCLNYGNPDDTERCSWSDVLEEVTLTEYAPTAQYNMYSLKS